MKYTSLEIASILEGKIEGDEKVTVNSISKIENGKKGDLCFVSNSKYTSYIYSSNASIIIINEDLRLEKRVRCTIIRVKDAYTAFSKLLEIYNKITKKSTGIDKNAYIGEKSTIGKDCYIGPFVFIGNNVKIGNNVHIYPHSFIDDNVTIHNNCTLFSGVKIYPKCIIGNDNIIHSGSIIGADGFGFVNIRRYNR